jgi:hypothetical protein
MQATRELVFRHVMLAIRFIVLVAAATVVLTSAPVFADDMSEVSQLSAPGEVGEVSLAKAPAQQPSLRMKPSALIG